MICRLCLCDLDNSVSICIFSDAEHGLPKAIAKYLQLEVSVNDCISTKLCSPCWQCLSDFDQFCAMVADKQQSLLLKTEPEPPPEPAVVVWNTESPIESKLGFVDDIKDHILCEPEIDVHDTAQSFENAGSTCSDNVEPDKDAFEADFEHATLTAATPKKTRGRTRLEMAATPSSPAPSSTAKAKSTATAKTKAKLVKVPVASASSQRESRVRSRELRRNAAAAEADMTPIPEPPAKAMRTATGTATAAGAGTAPKRGRPKGVKGKSKLPKPSKVARAPELEAKRSSIKEMDDYIAANVKLDCCLCAAPLLNFIDLKRHFRLQHNCTGYMECCNNRYKKRTLYVDHLHYHKDPQYFSCKPCRKSFLNRNSQDMHMLRFHSDQQQLVHQCVTCGARFAKKFLLTMHIKGHKGPERPEACDSCIKTFRSKLELTAHVKRMHASDFTPIICDICGANFRSKANFLIHKKALHPDGPVAEAQCHLCSRWLRDERSLRKHLARHDDREGGNKYRCVLCSAEKSSRVALSSHMRYHHSAKRHSCTLCGKEFKLPRALAEHMATHTGIDLYSCAFCTRTFKSHANMHNHKKKMHPNEWVRKYTQPSAAPVAGNHRSTDVTDDLAETANNLNESLQPPVDLLNAEEEEDEEEHEQHEQQVAQAQTGAVASYEYISSTGRVI
ncbi:transcription factor grauzone [Drosophila grimshawi]|uniref:GH12827 n=1 Tax=Drosophila grimshawi TaxID=7222 RepID=B4JLC2_DROGR|nr:transcription factor grauzone [Drosophila grimshawi]EDW00375.1 GH12827 [Drosophila grimshawi]